MTVDSTIILYSFNSLLRLDVLAWLIALPLIAFGIWYLWWQFRQGRKLTEELASLKKLNTHSIEYDLVLKAMKLTIWRIDIATRTLTYEIDYREGSDNLTSVKGVSLDEVYSYISPRHVQQMKEGFKRLLDGTLDQAHMQYQLRLPRSDAYYWGEGFVTVDKRDAEGHPLALVGTSMRIDHQKEIERQLIEARNQAEESDRLKTAFLANMSHEVRTPLNAIVGFSDILPMAQSEEERNELIRLIKENNAHLLRLFDDMLSMSRLEAGGGSVKKERFPLKPLFDEMAAKYEPQARANGVSVAVAPVDDDFQIVSDRDRLREILNQYINNAVKFTTAGSITIGCTNQSSGLRVWVTDTGKGIPEEHCNTHLFERFFKVDEFVPGTGLGLSICRSLALSIGGTVGVSSKLGEGSTFWVDLMEE
ncbi:MAG: HAMP domain-containing histidine kinase [Prevotella sp.]|nr:HAMP domain-containing histidine kinase [Prevotella sp.]